ncbi:MAG: polysaccharide deacetylase family protein [Polyangiaceae bacterium]
MPLRSRDPARPRVGAAARGEAHLLRGGRRPRARRGPRRSCKTRSPRSAVESHSMTHAYDLVQLGRERIRREVLDGFDAIERHVKRRPTSFRAPGYTLSDKVLDAVEEAGASVRLVGVYEHALLAGESGRARLDGAPRQAGARSILGSPRALAPTEPTDPGARGRAHAGIAGSSRSRSA